MTTWSVRARNLPEHASNPIHTDAGGRAAGFDRALVAGVTTYAYLTHPAAAGVGVGWGRDWVRRGGAEVRFIAPVIDDDPIDCAPMFHDDVWTIVARVGSEVRATSDVWAGGDGWASRPGDEMNPVDVVLDERWMDYIERAGDDLALYRRQGIVPPVTWPRLANDVFHDQLVTGAWIHTRSRIQHLDIARVGATAHIETTVFDRFETRSGQRAVADIIITVDGAVVAQIEHEALVSLHR